MTGTGLASPQIQFTYQGSPAAAGTLYVYQTGTTTKLNIYSDGGLTTPIANPITLDSNGMATFYTDGSVNIKLQAYTSTGTLIETLDPVYPVGGTASLPGNNTITNAMLAQGNGYTLNGNNTGAAANKSDIPAAAVQSMLGVGVTWPQGRLSLTTGVPVMAADVTGATTIYYVPYLGQTVPVYNGTLFQARTTGSQLSLALDSNSGHTGYQQANNLFDLFVFMNSTTLTLGTGPAWSSGTARGTGAGTTELQQLQGIWTNKNSVNLKIDATSAQVTIAANQATYVGTIFATADGQASMKILPAAASGGGNCNLLVYNAYNRVTVKARSMDSTSSWAYSTGSFRSANNSTSNRISFIDGLQQSRIRACYQVMSTTASVAYEVGVNLDSTSATPVIVARDTDTDGSTSIEDYFNPQLGFHYIQAMEYGGTGVSFFGKDPNAALAQTQSLTAELEM